MLTAIITHAAVLVLGLVAGIWLGAIARDALEHAAGEETTPKLTETEVRP